MNEIPETSYTIFTFNNLLYGVETIFIEQMFYLPELTPIPESPPDIIGVVNVRGEIIPIMDLNRRFGYRSSEEYQLSDSVIILRWATLQVGIIVNTIKQVINILPDEITSQLSYDQPLIKDEEKNFIDGIVSRENDLILLLNLENILRYIDSQSVQINKENLTKEKYNLYLQDDLGKPENEYPLKSSVFCPNATIYERDILLERAINLTKVTRQKTITETKPIAVIILNNERFGVDLTLVRELTQIGKITPIPCTPAYIIGNMNFRGEILTLIDIKGFLSLPLQSLTPKSIIMIIEIQGVRLGITIDDVYDVILLNPKKILSNSTKFPSIKGNYLEGVVYDRNKMMPILNLPVLFSHEKLLLEEAV